jgi:tetratricopeptide (TPR) repeat protein
MKKFFILYLFILAALKLSAATGDLDSLKQKLQLITNDSLKAPVYTEIAGCYLKYDTIVNIRKKRMYQNEALNYTMMALHLYSRYSDTTGLRVSFDNLAKVYHSQKKFSQAKWFILQSNSLSRIKNDTLNIITSLIKLSNIKMDIKEYKMAMRDLNEALSMSVATRTPKMEAIVQQNYGYLYNRMGDPKKGDIALKRADLINDSIKRDEEARLAAIQMPGDSIVVKKLITPTVKIKKKVIVSVGRKPSKKQLAKKEVASL